MEVGKKIKRLRLMNNLTLEELANRSELTKGYLSQLERDLVSPSVDTLEDVLEALGTTFALFFKKEEKEQIVFSEKDYFVQNSDEYDIHWIVPNAQKNDMEPILITIFPKQQSNVIEPHDGEEFGYVIEGSIILNYGEQNLTVKKGQTFYLQGGKQHYLYNNSETKKAVVIWVATPPIF